jgi:outer membrane lipoprotein LolB
VGFLLLVAFAVAGCRTATVGPVVDWPAEKKARQELASWELSGRAAVATAGDGWSAGIRWSQDGASSELNLTGALGIGGVRVRSDGQAFTIDTSKGEHIEAPDAGEALTRTLGVDLPVHNLRFWLLGVPAPQTEAVETFDAQGRLQQLEQDGWVGTFDRYALQDGRWLPGRVQIRQGDNRIRVIVSQWQLGGERMSGPTQ